MPTKHQLNFLIGVPSVESSVKLIDKIIPRSRRAFYGSDGGADGGYLFYAFESMPFTQSIVAFFDHIAGKGMRDEFYYKMSSETVGSFANTLAKGIGEDNAIQLGYGVKALDIDFVSRKHEKASEVWFWYDINELNCAFEMMRKIDLPEGFVFALSIS